MTKWEDLDLVTTQSSRIEVTSITDPISLGRRIQSLLNGWLGRTPYQVTHNWRIIRPWRR